MIEIKNLSKTFPSGDGTVDALKNVSLTIADGDIYGIIGMSGAGKSTLVRCINMLERPTDGQVLIDGTDLGALSQAELRQVRRRVSMIFQSFNLLAQRTCLKNIARALATNPKILLCDEATSALDPKTTGSVLSLIKDINRKMGITVIVITHQMSVVEEICNKVSILDHGNVVEEGAVSEVFSHPKSEAAKRLVFPDGVADTLPIKEGEHHIRVVFNGADAANTPLIAKLAMETHIAANILGANTKSIEGKAYGNMLLGISGDENTLQQAIAYLQKIDDIIVEEVSAHVR